METIGLRARVRQMVESGEMPCEEPGKLWAGRGVGTHCAACGQPITSTEVEFEITLASGVELRLHRLCHDVWREECEELTAPG